jgi:hypothetical protein
VKSTGETAVASAKDEFAEETSAVSASLSALGGSVEQLSDADARAAALAQVPAQIQAVGTSAGNLKSAVESSCS